MKLRDELKHLSTGVPIYLAYQAEIYSMKQAGRINLQLEVIEVIEIIYYFYIPIRTEMNNLCSG